MSPLIRRIPPATRSAPVIAAAIAGAATVAIGGFLLERNRERRAVRAFEHRLTVGTEPSPFDPGELEDLPAPARRFLLHALPMGTPTHPCTSLRMTGRIKQRPGGRWFPFKATEIINPARGLAWEGTIGLGPVSLHVTDTYAQGEGRTHLRLGGLIPIGGASGPDISHSAYGRLVAEAIFVPTSLLPSKGAHWEPIDDSRAAYTVALDGYETPVTITVDQFGRLQSLVLQRHGDPNARGIWSSYAFGAEILDEATFQGVTLPSDIRAGWHYGTEFFEPTLELHVTSATQPG